MKAYPLKPRKKYECEIVREEPQNDDPRDEKTTLWLIGKLETLMCHMASRSASIRSTISSEAESGQAFKEPDDSINARLYRLVETATDIKDILNSTADALGICDDSLVEKG